MTSRDFVVVVPFRNEERAIRATLASLSVQTDSDFTLVLVDNASTDATTTIIAEFLDHHPNLSACCIMERQKGTGAASDTGFRYAIAQGARYIARTDADCLPDRAWVANMKRAFLHDGLEFVIGQIRPRTDDIPLTAADRIMLPLLLTVAEHFGRLFRHGRQFKYPYVMVAGNNMALTSDLYLRAGGFPRTAIDETHEDKVLSEKIRTITARAQKRTDVVVYNSIRRVRKYGYWNTLLWYWDHKYRGSEVDVR